MKLNLHYAMLAKLTNWMQTQLQNFFPITQAINKYQLGLTFICN